MKASQIKLKQRGNHLFKSLILCWACSGLWPKQLHAVTANKVWFEFHQSFYRVAFEYTTPEIKEFRGGYADFKSKKEAEKFFWNLVRGADFQLGDPKKISFPSQENKPKPW